MFKGKPTEGSSAGDTIIAAGVKVEGDFTSEGNIIIEGEVIGSLHTAQDLVVGDNAKISADVSAMNARIAGIIRGNVLVRDRMEVAGTSRIDGDITTRVLLVEPGAQLNGRILMNADAYADVGEETRESVAFKTVKAEKAT